MHEQASIPRDDLGTCAGRELAAALRGLFCGRLTAVLRASVVVPTGEKILRGATTLMELEQSDCL